MKKHIVLLLIFLAVSCSTEKLNLSPLTESLNNSGQNLAKGSSEKSFVKNFNNTTDKVYSASEITNLISSFPKFGNDAVNKEIGNLKYYLKDYIQAIEAENTKGISYAFQQYGKSYKKIQKLRKYLNQDEDEVLNRYLVRIKTNMSMLESSKGSH